MDSASGAVQQGYAKLALGIRTTVGKEVLRAFAAAVRLPFSTIRTNVVMATNLSTIRIITPIFEVV